jgi:hypothetical protein
MNPPSAHRLLAIRVGTIVCKDDTCPCAPDRALVLRTEGRFSLTDLREAIQDHQDQARAAAVVPPTTP